MNFIALFLILLLIVVIIIQLGKVRNLTSDIRGVKKVERSNNDKTAVSLVVFMILFLVFCVVSALYYKNSMLGYGPHSAASDHGGLLDSLFNVTLFFTGVVFILTQIVLFWYAYKYRDRDNAKVLYFAHSTKLELIWTAIPAVVMTFLVVQGLMAWNEIMPDVKANDQYLEIEATGQQFAWNIRYPGLDGILGIKNIKHINNATNTLGIDWEDDYAIDDVLLGGADKIVLPVNTKVRVKITSKDVLHNFYLPHFRVKMDAIPGLPTYFIFTPITTTKEYRERLKDYPEWQELSDPEDPESPMRWEAFEFELACAELCGKGHYSMRRIVDIVTQEEYAAWTAGLESTYLSTIRNTDDDPRKGKGGLLKAEIMKRSEQLTTSFNNAIAADATETTINLEHVFFETGSSNLKDISKHELDNLTSLLKTNATVKVELAGHTDNTGDENANMQLSKLRATSAMNYLLSKGIDATRMVAEGYGINAPIETNDTPEGRTKNRRTELKITSK